MNKTILFLLLLVMPSIALAQNSDADKMSLDPDDKFERYLDGLGQSDDSTHNYAAFEKDGKRAIVDLQTKKATTPYKFNEIFVTQCGLLYTYPSHEINLEGLIHIF